MFPCNTLNLNVYLTLGNNTRFYSVTDLIHMLYLVNTRKSCRKNRSHIYFYFILQIVMSVTMYQVCVGMVVHVSTMMGLILVCVVSPGLDHSVISVGNHGYLTFYCIFFTFYCIFFFREVNYFNY